MKYTSQYLVFIILSFLFFSCSDDFEHAALVPKNSDIVLKLDLKNFEKKEVQPETVLNKFLGKKDREILALTTINYEKPLYLFNQLIEEGITNEGISFVIADPTNLKTQQEEIGHDVIEKDGVQISIIGNHVLLWKDNQAVLADTYGNKDQIISQLIPCFQAQDQGLVAENDGFEEFLEEQEKEISCWVSLKNVDKKYPQLQDMPETSSVSFFGEFNKGNAILSMQYYGLEKYMLQNFIRQGVSKEVLEDMPQVESAAYVGIALEPASVEMALSLTQQNELVAGLFQFFSIQDIANLLTGEIVYVVDEVQGRNFDSFTSFMLLGIKDRKATQKVLKQMGFVVKKNEFKHWLIPYRGKITDHSILLYQVNADKSWKNKVSLLQPDIEKTLEESPFSFYSNFEKFEMDNQEVVGQQIQSSEIKEIKITTTQRANGKAIIKMKNDDVNSFELLFK